MCVSDMMGMLPSGKARDFDSRIRWFKSIHPCLVSIFLYRHLLSPPTAAAVIKGISNVPGGFVERPH